MDTVVASGIITAASFSGDGSTLTGINTALGNGSLNSTGIATFSRLSTGANEVGINITADTITGPTEIFIDPAGVGVNTGRVRIKGDLFVDGTSFSVHEGDIEFGDFVIGIASTAFSNALLDGAGIGIGSTGIRKFIRYNNSSDALKSSEHFDLASGKRYKINGAGVLYANGLGAGVVNSALQQLGTLNDLNVTGIATFNNNVKLLDDDKLLLGTGEDLQIYMDGSASFIDDVGSGDLSIRGSSIILGKPGSSEAMLKAVPDAEVNLYFDGINRLKTANGGVIVTGVTTSSGGFSGNLSGTATLATDLAINGTNQIVYQDSNNDSDVLPTGSAGQILASSGAGAAPQWVTSAPAGAIEGITIRDESAIVGTANSVSTINFLGDGVVADAAAGAGIATVTISAITGLGVSMGGGSVGTAVTGIDFEGSLVSVDAVSNTGIATIRVEGLSVKDEGSSVGTAGSITSINFVGAGIAAAASGDTATVTVAGGVSNADVVALAIALG